MRRAGNTGYTARFADWIYPELSYDPEKGSFTFAGAKVDMWRCKAHTLVVIDGVAVPAHRLAFEVMGFELDDNVVYFLDGDKHNTCADNLIAIPRAVLARVQFVDRRIALDCAPERWRVDRDKLLEPYRHNSLSALIGFYNNSAPPGRSVAKP